MMFIPYPLIFRGLLFAAASLSIGLMLLRNQDPDDPDPPGSPVGATPAPKSDVDYSEKV
jgi:hypothetical protein